MKNKSNWNVRATKFAMNSINPIRKIVENLQPNPEKSLIPLSIGDPTVFGNLRAPEELKQCIVDAVHSMKFNGYLPSNGLPAAREAVARYSSTENDPISPNDVFITSGCSHALDLCISLLAESGQNILIPRPGFLLYQTLAHGFGIKTKFYDLVPERDFEIDLHSLEAAIDKNTAAIIFNNPSNPCGSVYSVEHIKQVLQIANKHCLPIIADEIYEHMVFPGQEFVPIASLSENVPILSCRGTTKRFLVPGFRLGWIIVHDRQNRFGSEIRMGLSNLCQRILGANSIIQGALPAILEKTPQHFFDSTVAIIKENAEISYERLRRMPGLHPYKPAAAMYMMISIDMQNYPQFESDTDFIEALLSQQSVFCLPGKCFGVQNLMRIVLTLPPELTQEAMDRIELFCLEHFRPSIAINNACSTTNTSTTTTTVSNGNVEIKDTVVIPNGRPNHQDKENAVNGSAKLPILKKLSTASESAHRLSAMLSSNLSNLLAVDPDENEMLVQVFQK